MQETRQHILEILKEHGEATVGEMVDSLCERRGEAITAVTVRHHLNVLQTEGLVAMPQLLHRTTPGRPQHVYALTDKAEAHFPNNYQRLATGLLNEMKKSLSSDTVNVILEGVATTMADEARIPKGTMPKRLDAVVRYLTEHGYEARWEEDKQGYILHTHNCPYHHIAHDDDTLCQMDMRLISSMLGVVPRMVASRNEGDTTCSYFVPDKA